MRINASLVGELKTYTSSTLSGVYSVTESFYLEKSNTWNSFAFPIAYSNLINTFSDIVYVTNYNDLKTAVNNASSNTPTAIVVGAGYYTSLDTSGLLVDQTSTGASAMIGDLGKPISFICSPGQVVFDWISTLVSRDGPMFYFTNPSSAIYGAYLKRNNNGKTNTYSVSFTRGPGGRGILQNCILGEYNANGNWTRNYAPSGTQDYQINYCSIYVNENGSGDFSSSATASYNYCVCNYARGTGTTPWLNSAENVTYNTDFSITGNSTQGVYAGTYAWDSSQVTVNTST